MVFCKNKRFFSIFADNRVLTRQRGVRLHPHIPYLHAGTYKPHTNTSVPHTQ